MQANVGIVQRETSREVELARRDNAALFITDSLHDLAATSSWAPEYASCLALKLVNSAESPRLWRFKRWREQAVDASRSRALICAKIRTKLQTTRKKHDTTKINRTPRQTLQCRLPATMCGGRKTTAFRRDALSGRHLQDHQLPLF